MRTRAVRFLLLGASVAALGCGDSAINTPTAPENPSFARTATLTGTPAERVAQGPVGGIGGGARRQAVLEPPGVGHLHLAGGLRAAQVDGLFAVRGPRVMSAVTMMMPSRIRGRRGRSAASGASSGKRLVRSSPFGATRRSAGHTFSAVGAPCRCTVTRCPENRGWYAQRRSLVLGGSPSTGSIGGRTLGGGSGAGSSARTPRGVADGFMGLLAAPNPCLGREGRAAGAHTARLRRCRRRCALVGRLPAARCGLEGERTGDRGAAAP